MNYRSGIISLYDARKNNTRFGHLPERTKIAYLPDTNVLIDFGRDPVVRTTLENARRNGAVFLVGPPALIELVRGMVMRGRDSFEQDREVFIWLHTEAFEVLPLPRAFMAKVLRTSPTRRSGVEPLHYRQLMQMIVDSANFDDFLRRSRGAGSVWQEIGRADEIHRDELDKELSALEDMARAGGGHGVATRLARTFGAPGCRPNPLILERQFSAAIEFLESSLAKIRAGSKPRKNDPGLYVDFQLLFYLAEPEVIFLSLEDFSKDIRRSRQRTRIVGLDSLR